MRDGLVVAAFLGLASCTSAQDWPGWRGPGRDARVPGFHSPAVWPKDLRREWRIEVGAGHSTPALVGGRLYVHARQEEDEVILSLDAVTGRLLWSERYPAPYEALCRLHPQGKGPLSSPAVFDGRVFCLGIGGILSCLDAGTGRVLWRHTFRDRFPDMMLHIGTGMSPLVRDGVCFVHVGGSKGGAILALDAASGKIRWSWEGDGPSCASPVVAEIAGELQLITLTQSHAVGLRLSDGALLWKLDFRTAYDLNWVTPIVLGDLIILSGHQRGIVAFTLEGREPKPAWRSNDVSMFMSSPILKEDRLIGFSDRRKGQLFCLDARTGETLWLGEPRQGESAAILDAGDVLLALTTRSELIVFEANDKAYSERARYTVADTPTWAHPVVAGSAIFVREEKILARWVIP